MDIVEKGREILRAESAALTRASELLDEHFAKVVERVQKLPGKVVLTGVGKSGIIAQKIAATLSSTGTPALFLHSVEAVMGDLGILSPDDLLIAISNSGETSEVVNVVHAAARIGTPAVAMTKNPKSTLAQECELLLPIFVDREAGHLSLAPTTSTTVTLALGDALAMILMEARSFSPEDFARFHPGGNLGRRLALKVRDIMRTGQQIPQVTEAALVRDAVDLMSEKDRLGVCLVTDESGALTGIFTDGDLRRLVEHEAEHQGEVAKLPIRDHMSRDPITVDDSVQASEALRIMENSAVFALPCLDEQGLLAGIIHIHDILGRGKFMI